MRRPTIVILAVLALLAALLAGIAFRYLYFGPYVPKHDYAADYDALAASVANLSKPDEEGWKQLDSLLMDIDALYLETFPSLSKDANGRIAYASAVDLYKAIEKPDDVDNLRSARRFLAAARESKIFTRLASLDSAKALIPPRLAQPLALHALTDHTRERQLARLIRLRYTDAQQRGDTSEMIESARNAATLARLVGSRPLLLSRLVANAISMLVADEIAATLQRTRLPPAVNRALARSLDIQYQCTLEHTLRGQRLADLDAMSILPEAWRATSRSRLIRRYESVMEQCIAYVKLDPWTRRSTTPPLDAPQADVKDLFQPAKFATQLVTNDDECRTILHGRMVWLAIEAWIGEKGAPPTSLQALVPTQLAALPIDPMSRDGFVYKRLDTPHGADYLLMSVGFDGVDNAGATLEKEPFQALRPKGRGYDYVFHTPPSQPN